MVWLPHRATQVCVGTQLQPGYLTYRVDARVALLFPVTIYPLRDYGRKGVGVGRRRTEMRKLPRSRPMISNCAALSAPPLLEILAGLPAVSSATSGERLRASRGILSRVPLICTVSVRCSLGARGEESASKVKARKVIENGGAGGLAHEASITAGPDSRSAGGSTTRSAAEKPSTRAGFPATRTLLEAASPQKPLPKSSNRSVSEAKEGAEETRREEERTSAGVRIVA